MKQFPFAFCLLAAALLGCASAADFQPNTLAIGASAPNFSLPGVDGKTHTLKDFASSSAKSESGSNRLTVLTGAKDRNGFDNTRNLNEDEFNAILEHKPDFKALLNNYIFMVNRSGVKMNTSNPKIIW